ncbi:MAG: hypothetical protein PVF05_03140 [Gemmatimonadales bacterium]
MRAGAPTRAAAALSLVLTMTLITACGGADSGRDSGAEPGAAERRLAQFAPTTISFDDSLLDANQRKVVAKLVEASRHLDDAFKLQYWRGNAHPEDVLPAGTSEEADAIRAYYQIMYGPWDELEGDEPFLDVGRKPEGAGFYPEDMTREEFDEWIEEHPGDRDAFTSGYTVIRRTEDGGLEAVPYSEAYRAELEPAAKALREAAAAADNPSLKSFLEQRADALLSDEYYDSEVAWMRLEDNLVDPTLGPYEVYEDGLFGQKTSFESFIGLKDPGASEQLARLESFLPDLERALPIPDEHKYLDRPFTSPISVVDLIYAAGEAGKGVQTIAFNLPNDPKVREEEGSKKVMLRNVIQAKFDKILKPIAEEVLVKEQADRIGPNPYFTRVLMHELSHGLGPDYVTGKPDVTVNQALKDRYSAIEEAKADAVGTHSLGILTDRGEYDEDFRQEVYIDHVADMFRCIRFGATEAHGLGCLTQLNYLLQNGAITYDEESGKFAADLEAMPEVMSELASQYLLIEATGDYAGAGQFLERYGKMPPEVQDALDRLAGRVPVDLDPHYAVTDMGES